MLFYPQFSPQLAFQVALLACCRLSEPIVFTSIPTYLPVMLGNLISSTEDVGFWVELNLGMISACQCLSALGWSSMSDLCGRRPAVLGGLLIAIVPIFMLGFATSLTWCLVSCCLIGVGLGNVGILRTTVAELVTDGASRPFAFSLLPMMWNIGSILGPAIGSAYRGRSEVENSNSSGRDVSVRFPSLLPNLICALLLSLVMLFVCLFFQETHPQFKGRCDWGLQIGAVLRGYHGDRSPYDSLGQNPTSAYEHCPRILDNYPKINEEGNTTAPAPLRTRFTSQCSLVLAAWALLAAHSLVFDELLIVLAIGRQETGEGLGLTTRQSGLLLTSCAILVVIVQLVAFPYIIGRVGELSCLRGCAFVFPFIYLVTPSLVILDRHRTWKIITLGMVALLKGVCSMISFPSAMVVLSNSALSTEHLSFLNSVAMIAKGITRIAASATIGLLYSWALRGGYILMPWFGLAGMGYVAALPLYWLHDNCA